MKIGNKFLLAALLIIGACSTAPALRSGAGANNEGGYKAEFHSLVKRKIYLTDFRAYGSTPNKAKHYITFKDDDYVLNAMVPAIPLPNWTWARLYKIIHYYSSNRIAIRIENPDWDFPDWTAIEGKDQIHIMEVSGDTISRTLYGAVATFEDYSPENNYDDSPMEKIGSSVDLGGNYPKILTIYGPLGDDTGVSEPFDPLNP